MCVWLINIRHIAFITLNLMLYAIQIHKWCWWCSHLLAVLWTCPQWWRQWWSVWSLSRGPEPEVWAGLWVHSLASVHWSSGCNRPASSPLPDDPLTHDTHQDITWSGLYFYFSSILCSYSQRRLLSLSFSWRAMCLSSYDLHKPVVCSINAHVQVLSFKYNFDKVDKAEILTFRQAKLL